MRLFFTLELPPDVRAALAAVRPGAPPADDYKWVEEDLLHVTLAFLGEQPEAALPRLTEIGQQSAVASQPARLQVGDLAILGPPRAPRVLLTHVGGDVPALRQLQATLAGALGVAGFRLEERPFAPHITLARRRNSARAPLGFPWPPHRALPHLAVPMDQFVLMRSVLSSTGPTYTPLATFPLGG